MSRDSLEHKKQQTQEHTPEGGKWETQCFDKAEAAMRRKMFESGRRRRRSSSQVLQAVCVSAGRINTAAAGRGLSLRMCSIWHCSLDRWKGAYLD